ncbi:MAG: UDP-N-acetylmuramoyl-tripeptide--D-alanyl-D-alanine ligase [Candidatus Tokpelaia sp. JSC085]|nr:MAG: UDP-N-acetylmuramoyl-tripeptide--D-alanyl-D-alanine ligase [Candidatus Tokpelaia sp. JSC085]
MSILWKRCAFFNALGGSGINPLHEDITGISIDTRTLKRGDAFFAIRGHRFDGHDFAPEAAEKGASVIIIAKDNIRTLQKISVPLVIVDNVLSALSRLATAARARCRARIIAVTGSVGKTTTKEAIRHAFSCIGRVHANAASFNNHWGVPITLACMPADTHFGVFEIGMNHKNEIRSLVKLVAPDVVVITRIGAAHLEHFNSIEAIATAKAEIFEGVLLGGTALLNADDPLFSYMEKKAYAAGITHVVSYGEAIRADYRLLDVQLHEDYACFQANLGRKKTMIRRSAPGYHMVQNMLAVLGIADVLNIDIERIALALQDFRPVNGRGARYRLALPSGGTFLLIDESYNANPVSMQAGLSLLGKSSTGDSGRRIAVLGDMLELGRLSREAHENLAGPVRDSGIQIAFLGGHAMKYLADILHDDLQVYYREVASDLLPLLLDHLHAGDAVMVKSSNGVGFSHIVTALLERYRPIADKNLGFSL